jgi:hypothetical protein
MHRDKIIELAEKTGATHKQFLGVYQFFVNELTQFVREIQIENSKKHTELVNKLMECSKKEQSKEIADLLKLAAVALSNKNYNE